MNLLLQILVNKIAKNLSHLGPLNRTVLLEEIMQSLFEESCMIEAKVFPVREINIQGGCRGDVQWCSCAPFLG